LSEVRIVVGLIRTKLTFSAAAAEAAGATAEGAADVAGAGAVVLIPKVASVSPS
jgi:hypothetical protein